MSLALRLAFRELRGGLQGLRLLAVCLVLGVAALAGVGSLSSAIRAGLQERGQEVLGGDIEARVTSGFATPAELARLRREGPLAVVVKLRGMAGGSAGDARTLAEIKAVDGGWPLYGRFSMQGGGRTVAPGQVALSSALAERLKLGRGDTVEIGSGRFAVAGIIAEEPDKAGDGFGFGPGLLMRTEDLEATGLLAPGSQFRSHYRLRLPASVDPEALVKRLEAEMPASELRYRDRSNGAPGTQRFVERLGQFLTLVGLTALVVSGVGVGGGVGAYLAARTRTIATLKILGADSRLVRTVYLWQIGLVAAGAVLVGLVIGAAAPWVAAQVAADALPVPPSLAIQWGALAAAAGYGLLIALMFALWPLSEAAATPAARLYRSLTERPPRPSLATALIVALAAVMIVLITLLRAEDKLVVVSFLGAALLLVLLLWGLAALVKLAAAAAPRPRAMLLRLALANLHRPGAPTRQLVVALGLGLTLFATLATIESNFNGQINRTIPERAPSFFIIDIPKVDRDRFEAAIDRAAPGAEMAFVPSLRGPVTAVRGVPVADMEVPEGAWILRGDRGLSYAAALPAGNELISGQWWPADYAGPPLISIDDGAATSLGLKIGDTLTISVLGVEITAKLASTRKIDWQSLGFNFGILFSPGVLEAAPHGWMATVAVPPAGERAVQRAVGDGFPTASLVRVKDVIDQVSTLLGQLSAAIRAAASVTVAAGIAVLVGALAAGARARTYDAVLLKLLGASRRQVAATTLIEYGLLAAIVAGLALLLGSVAGWFVITQVFELEWQPIWWPVVATVLVGAVVTVVLGLLGSWQALSARPNAVLRGL
ncbi:ABC transporter permease [Polymorphobacter sp.]|uniref:ABC transporter permease n=1 Tax=Polymorphobacter sp. TaxID=1909290 RepID=UPI003F6E9C15